MNSKPFAGKNSKLDHWWNAGIVSVCILLVLSGATTYVQAQDSLRTVTDSVVVDTGEVVVTDDPDTVAIKSYARRFSPPKGNPLCCRATGFRSGI